MKNEEVRTIRDLSCLHFSGGFAFDYHNHKDKQKSSGFINTPAYCIINKIKLSPLNSQQAKLLPEPGCFFSGDGGGWDLGQAGPS